MAREPQKATSKKDNAASEENNQQEQNIQYKTAPEDEGRPLFRLIDLTGGREQHDDNGGGDDDDDDDGPAHRRRIAPEYTLVWSPEVLHALKGRSEKYVRNVTAATYARIYLSEARLYGLKFLYVFVLSSVTIEELNGWWRAFKVGNTWFKLRYTDERVREYELLPADGPSFPDEEPPTQSRQQKVPPPKSVGRRPRVRRNRNGITDILNAAPPRRGNRGRNNERILIELLAHAASVLQVLRSDIVEHKNAAVRTLRPRLLRNLVRIRQVGGNAMRSMCDVRSRAEHVVRHCVALVREVHQTLRTSNAHQSVAVRSEARLESRVVGQNTGFNLVLSSWHWSEPPPVDWSLWLFGVDWNLNIFGVPEEEQAYTA